MGREDLCLLRVLKELEHFCVTKYKKGAKFLHRVHPFWLCPCVRNDRVEVVVDVLVPSLLRERLVVV